MRLLAGRRLARGCGLAFLPKVWDSGFFQHEIGGPRGYPERSSEIVTRALAARVEHFFQMKRASGDDMYVFPDNVSDTVIESSELRTFVAALPAEAREWQRVRAVRATVPSYPRPGG